MLFLFGERVYFSQEEVGIHPCPVCREQTPFYAVVETNYFTIFAIRLLPIEKLSHYWECSGCENAYAVNDLNEPSHLKVLRRVLVYLMLGYGIYHHRDSPGTSKVREIGEKVSGISFTDELIKKEITLLEAGQLNLQDYVAEARREMNLKGKRQVIEGAMLMTHICCEMEYEDRLRLNLMGNALGLELQSVAAIIDSVQRRNYFGLDRLKH